jgi:hypothetical protein
VFARWFFAATEKKGAKNLILKEMERLTGFSGIVADEPADGQGASRAGEASAEV